VTPKRLAPAGRSWRNDFGEARIRRDVAHQLDIPAKFLLAGRALGENFPRGAVEMEEAAHGRSFDRMHHDT
jgi:hypothetical protein